MRKVVILLSVILIQITTACGNAASSPSTMYNSPQSDEIHIGIAYPVAIHDKDTYLSEGIDLAVNTINANGGVLGKTLNTVVRDDRSDTNVAMQIAETFHEQGITAVVGHWSTNISYFAEDVYEQNKVVMITPDATGMNLFDYDYQYIYRMIASNQVCSEAIAEYMKSAGLRRIAIYYDDDEYGNDFSSTLEKAMAKQDIVVIDRVSSFAPSNADTVMERWSAFGCDGVVLASNNPDIVGLVRLIHASDNRLPVFGADNLDRIYFNRALDTFTGPVYIASYRKEDLDPAFLSAFRAAYGAEPDTHSISGYESVYMLKDAMEAVGSADGTAIAGYLSQLKDYKTISGTYTYNPETSEFEGFNVSVRRMTP